MLLSLIFVSLTSHAASPLSGKWILQTSEIKATSGDCPLKMEIKAGSDSLKIKATASINETYKKKFSDYGRDGRITGGCSSGTSMFTFESWSSCSWDMDHSEKLDNGARVQVTSYSCKDKACVKREVRQRDQYAIQADQKLLFTDRWFQGTELQKINCTYVRQSVL